MSAASGRGPGGQPWTDLLDRLRASEGAANPLDAHPGLRSAVFVSGDKVALHELPSGMRVSASEYADLPPGALPERVERKARRNREFNTDRRWGRRRSWLPEQGNAWWLLAAMNLPFAAGIAGGCAWAACGGGVAAWVLAAACWLGLAASLPLSWRSILNPREIAVVRAATAQHSWLYTEPVVAYPAAFAFAAQKAATRIAKAAPGRARDVQRQMLDITRRAKLLHHTWEFLAASNAKLTTEEREQLAQEVHGVERGLVDELDQLAATAADIRRGNGSEQLQWLLAPDGQDSADNVAVRQAAELLGRLAVENILDDRRGQDR